jgi:3-oxoacyl-[acyl-carrier protein] reductase
VNLSLKGQTAVVTGAGEGIGAAIVGQLAGEGVDVAAIARTREKLDALAEELAPFGVRIIPLSADVADPPAIASAIERAASELGKIDVLVNNAGTTAFGTFDDLEDSHWLSAVDVKLMGYVRCVREVLPHMRSRRTGRIINLVGMAGRYATPGYALGAVNAALLHFTRSLADHLASDGIFVNAINPGPTATPRMTEALRQAAATEELDPETFAARYVGSLPIGRLIRPDEVARTVALLCTGVLDLTSGSALQVDGGAAPGIF